MRHERAPGSFTIATLLLCLRAIAEVIRRCWWSWALLLLSGACGCSVADATTSIEPLQKIATSKQRILTQNSLTTNNIVQNNIVQNNIVQNNIVQNNIVQNNIVQNNIVQNNIVQNSLLVEGLRESPGTRQLLQYIYACAMPTGVNTTIDPNDGGLACGPGGSCDKYYTCSSDNKCVVDLKGWIGVGINADDTGWWESNHCDETCQRWVTACLLARTNAYGVTVDISLRAPADAPARIKAALAVSDAERYGIPNDPDPKHRPFCLREGAYYGNIFAQTPVAGNPELVKNTPTLNACAGPGSNIPELTKRFCSSQGDQVVINVPGLCLSTPAPLGGTEQGVCTGVDGNSSSPTYGAISGCYTDTTLSGNPYKEVITVFLQQPIATCGNGVCENQPFSDAQCPAVTAGEDEPASPAYCASDCHPGSWAKDYPASYGFGTRLGPLVEEYPVGEGYHDALGQVISAVAPADDSIVVVGQPSVDVDLGAGMHSGSAGFGLIAKYTSSAVLVWYTRYLPSSSSLFRWGLNGVTVAPNGNITVVGSAMDDLSPNLEANTIWIRTFDAVGGLLSSSSVPVFYADPTVTGHRIAILPNRAIAIDHQGNVIVTGQYLGDVSFGSFSLSSGIHSNDGDLYVAKISPNGTPIWARSFGGSFPAGLALDSHDNILFASFGSAHPGGLLQKLSPDGSSVLWEKIGDSHTGYSVVAVAPNDDVYLGGYFDAGADLGAGPITATKGTLPFVVKYGSDGARAWEKHPSIVCPSGKLDCGLPLPAFTSAGGVMMAYAVALGFDPAGNVILGSYGNPVVGGGIDFGVGTFPTYQSANVSLAAYSPDAGEVRWAKQFPTVLGSSLIGMAFDSHGRVVVSGGYSGSMQIDDRVLVTSSPAQFLVVDSYLASFAGPPPSDNTPSDIGAGHDQSGSIITTVPDDILAQATGPDGADVFFMPPTAIDSGNAGTSVACSPPPNTKFPIGVTPVTCIASDPRGNRSDPAAGTFKVKVVDTLGPVFTGIPAAITTPASAPGGAVVTYTPPTASDQVDGSRPVTCNPPSGSTFHGGVTTVTCSSTDTRGNTSGVRFAVTVVDTTPPVLTLPGTITVTATNASGAIVNYSATATDLVDGPVTPVCVLPSGSTFGLGLNTVQCTATDSSGNQATGSFQIKVEYGAFTILQPVNADGSSVFKLGSTVPVKFQLTGSSGIITNAVASLTLAKVSSTVIGTDIEAVSTSAATTGNLFRYDSGQYIFNLSTKGLSTGTWRLSIDLHDGVVRTVNISLR